MRTCCRDFIYKKVVGTHGIHVNQAHLNSAKRLFQPCLTPITNCLCHIVSIIFQPFMFMPLQIIVTCQAMNTISDYLHIYYEMCHANRKHNSTLMSNINNKITCRYIYMLSPNKHLPRERRHPPSPRRTTTAPRIPTRPSWTRSPRFPPV